MRQAAFLNANPALTVTLEGHCDERGTRNTTSPLVSAAVPPRATSCWRRGRLGRIRVVSYGKERPAAAGSNESSWAKNRRADGHQLGAYGILMPVTECMKRGLALLFFANLCRKAGIVKFWQFSPRTKGRPMQARQFLIPVAFVAALAPVRRCPGNAPRRRRKTAVTQAAEPATPNTSVLLTRQSGLRCWRPIFATHAAWLRPTFAT